MKRLIFALFLAMAVIPAYAAEPDEPIRTGEAISPDGVTIHCAMLGEDEPVIVFVHGWCIDGGYFRRQVAHFAGDHRTVAVDLAGHGASHRNREVFTMEAFGADVVAVLEEFNLRKVILVGHSMGGAVMVEAALAAPDRVIGVIGIDNFQNVNMKLTPEQIDGFLADFRSEFRKTTYLYIKTMFPDTADSLLVEGIATDVAMAPSKVGISAMDELLKWYGGLVPERVKALEIPLVTVNSDAVPVDDDALRALVPDYRVWMMSGVGHYPMLEDPDQFNATLAEAVAYLTELADR